MNRTRGPRTILTTLALAAGLAFSGLTLAASPAQAVNDVVPDANFRACLNTKYLGAAATAPISSAQLNGVGYVDCDDLPIVSIEGAQYLTGLTSLILNNDQIVDVTPLAGLTNLTYLNLSMNKIVDATPLAGLTNLTELWTPYNQIANIAPLAGLTNLTTLAVGFNPIADVAPLAGLTKLTSLFLYKSQIANLAPLARLTNLIELYLDGNRITDLAPLTGLTNLTVLSLSDNQIADLAPLAGLTNLVYLWLRGNQIADLAPLAGLTRLADLILQGNRIANIAPLTGLTNLTFLDMQDNQIAGVAPLAGLTNLTTLHLSSNQIADVAPLAGLTNLTTLYLDYNRIANLSPLATLTSAMANLSAYGQQVTVPLATPGTYPWPVKGLPGYPVASASSSSPAVSVDLAKGMWTLTTPGTYTVTWSDNRSTNPRFTGTLMVTDGTPPSGSGVPMYRLYNPATGEHFYTSSLYEATVDVASGVWNSEGIGWFAPETGTPVYRLRAIPGTGSAGHLYSTNRAEIDKALSDGGWMDEGIGWYSDGPISVFRQYKAETGQHNYTSDFNEIQVITTSQGWVQELIVDGTATPAWLGKAPGVPTDQTVNDAAKTYRG